MQAEEYLAQIEKLDKLIENRNAEAERWREKSMSLGGFSSAGRVQESKDPHKAENIMAKYIDIEAEVEALKAQRKSIIKTIERLPAKEYDVLHKFYVQHISLKAIAINNGKAYSWVTKTKGKAMNHLQTILDGK